MHFKKYTQTSGQGLMEIWSLDYGQRYLVPGKEGVLPQQ